MAALTVSALRQRLATQLSAHANWAESPFDHLRLTEGAATPGQHQQYALEVTRTERSLSQHSAVTGALVDTSVVVHWLYRRNQKDHTTTLDAALDAEQTLILQVLAVSKADLAVYWSSTDREFRGEWIVGRTEFTCTHALALLAA